MLAFAIGLISTLHCFGMCGGIVGALTMSLDPKVRNNKTHLFRYSLAYNIGRILSYTFAGLLVGALSQFVFTQLLPSEAEIILRIIAALLIIILGIFIAGWTSKVALIEKLGVPLWNKLQPLGQGMLPVKTPFHAFLFGAVWGWLPCGLVYYSLLLAITTQSALDAAAFMALFGAGTIIPMLVAGMLAGRFTHIHRAKWMRDASGGLLVLTGLVSLFLIANS